MKPQPRVALIGALLLALAGAQLCVWLDTPLPWMIGPLFATAIACMFGAPLRAPLGIRASGQWVIGTTLGLYFTAPVVAALVSYSGWIAVGIVFALLLGFGAGVLLHGLSGTDRCTAFFAMAVGGAAEMATQGERHGAAVDRVAASHSLRLMMVVGTIPFLVRWWTGHGHGPGLDLFVPGATAVSYGALLVLICLTGLGGLACLRLDVPNAWVIGPLFVAIGLTVGGVHLSRLPEWMVAGGQLCIGISLGTRFTPGFVHTAPRFLVACAACTLVMMLLGAGFGATLAALGGINPGTAILATSPGGIAEMSLTARNLHLGVPIVTAFHVSRMVAVVLLIGPLYRLSTKFQR
ncbi:AbrB family transcriptional regulator [Massilia eurypsychrophila]|uniref:AbrB family transcriptional regulator n=1 Tax=Massilia eurypsychrophila TaxID=1485217 RepID=UPI001E4D67CE|nr:AbrB family transcriptional regulator [Massilia eurypsychrophila]